MAMSEASYYVQWFRNRLASMIGGGSHNGLRDYDLEFGYPNSVTSHDLWRIYKRNGIASRIIRAFPQATWEEQPVIRDEKGDSAEEKGSDGLANKSFSPFVQDVDNFMLKTKALRYLERADRLSSIGHFGILLMGFKDGAPMREPLAAGKKPLLFLQAYGEPTVKILEFVGDTNDPRYGLPKLYEVTPGFETQSEGGTAPVQGSFQVHASRCIHVAEFLDQGEVQSTPRLQPVYNHLLDLQKVVGSSAESFWRQSNPGIAFSADADAKIDPAMIELMKEQAAEFENQMRRIIAMQGMTPHMLNTMTIADPAPNIEKLLDLIAGGTGIPKRILVGSERGELASSQDSDNWASRIDERQNNYAGPSLLMPFVQKMVDTGNVMTPEERMWAVWSPSNALSPKDQAEVGRIKATALKEYASAPAAEMIVPPQEFRRDFLDLPPESEFEVEDVEEEDDTLTGDGTGDALPPADDAADDAPVVNIRTYRATVEKFGAARAVRMGPGVTIIAPRVAGLKVNATPRTLYVRRDLLNAEDVREHFKAQGVTEMVEGKKMHVTLAYSRIAVDWMKVGQAWTDDAEGNYTLRPGGARPLELLGAEKDVLVQLFVSSELAWRHEDMKLAGATWDYPEYQPHVSLTWNLAPTLTERLARMAELEPYTGKLVFGPEMFEEVKENWKATIKENKR